MSTIHFRIDDETKRLAMQAAKRLQLSLTELIRQRAEELAASATDDKFVSMIGILRENPLAGVKAGKTANQRKLTVPRFPFIIVYVAKESVVRILHTSRKIAGRYSKGSGS